MAKTTKMLTKEDIIAVPDIHLEQVDVPEWGGAVMIKPLTAGGRDRFEDSVTETKNGQTKLIARNFRAKLVARCVVDEAGLRLFTEDDVEMLGKKSAKAMSRVFDAIATASGMTKEDIKSLEGKSESQGEDSDTD